jgi:GT2 family glycosyltransferase
VSDAARPLVRVVVVDHDGGNLTLGCLRSVLGSDWPADRLQVVLVDNASVRGVVERVERESPSVTVVRNAVNLGFAGGCNSGLHGLDDVEYVALLNNDATVDPGWLEPLVAELEAHPELGAACPKVLLAGTGRIDNVGVELGEWGRGADRGHGQVDDGRYDTPSEVFAWCGAAVLLRRAYLDTVGKFDERLFLYCEDLELAWRGRAFGWRYRAVPSAVVHHHHGATAGAGSPLQRWYNLRNALLVSLRHAPWTTTAAAAARSVAAIPYAAVRHPHDVPVRLRAFGDFLRLAPAMTRSRREDRRRVLASEHTSRDWNPDAETLKGK